MLIYGTGLILVLVACCGLAIDLGNFEITRLKMQNAADATALGTVVAYEDGGSDTGGIQDAALNGFTSGSNNVTITLSNPPASGAYTGNAYAVQAVLTKSVTGTFIRRTFLLSSQATAVGIPTPCVYFLSPTNQPSLQITNETIQGSCPFYLGASYTFSGSSSSSGSAYFVAGPSANSSGTVSPSAYFGSPTMTDPLSYIAAPTIGSCTYKNISVTAKATLSPGTYCGGLTINTSAAVTLNPGMYIVLGALSINGPTLTGTGVTFFVSQGDGYSYGASSIQNVNAILTAPTSGTWQGLLYFSDRTLPAEQANLTVANWNGATRMDGIFYLAGQELSASNVTLEPKAYLGFVCDYATINNTAFEPAANYSSLAGGNPFHPLNGGAGIVE